jgi:RimJ/RimL family protein N-acetyltransferase
MNVERVVLQGQRVRLEPLAASHLVGLAAAIHDGELWRIPVTFVPHPDQLPAFFADAEAAFLARRELAFATFDGDRIVGSTRFRCIEASHQRVEIGFTFVRASSQRTHVNTEAKYLMLRHAFEVWECNRVELLTDELNAKSRSAIARLGAQQEGILRSHMVMRDGRIRNSVMYGLVKGDWPHAKRILEARLAD